MRGWYAIGIVLLLRSIEQALEPKRQQAHTMNYLTHSNDKRPRLREGSLAQHSKQRRGSDVCSGGSLVVSPTAYLSYQPPPTPNTPPSTIAVELGTAPK